MAKQRRPQGRGNSQHRVAEDIRMKASQLLIRELRDPRLAGLSVTRVDLTADLSRARVFYRLLPGIGSVDEAEAAAPAAARYLRRELARTLQLRHSPEIELLHDDVPDEAARVDELLAGLREARGRKQAEGREALDGDE